MTARLTAPDLAAIRRRYELFAGPEAEAMPFAEYSELYDQFVGEDLPRLMEHLKIIEEERSVARG